MTTDDFRRLVQDAKRAIFAIEKEFPFSETRRDFFRVRVELARVAGNVIKDLEATENQDQDSAVGVCSACGLSRSTLDESKRCFSCRTIKELIVQDLKVVR